MSPKHFDYDRLEEALESGAVQSRQQFYALAGARWSVQRKRLLSGLFPEHRAIFNALPSTTPHRSRQYAAKLSEAQVQQVHHRHADGWKVASIAAMLEVSRPTIYDILAGRTWPHLHPNPQEES